jgi:hypothetical protein
LQNNAIEDAEMNAIEKGESARRFRLSVLKIVSNLATDSHPPRDIQDGRASSAVDDGIAKVITVGC